MQHASSGFVITIREKLQVRNYKSIFQFRYEPEAATILVI